MPRSTTTEPLTPVSASSLSSISEPLNSPEWTGFFGATYEWALNAGEITAHAGYQYRSKTHVATRCTGITRLSAAAQWSPTSAYL